jgi:microcystin-dependent protein
MNQWVQETNIKGPQGIQGPPGSGMKFKGTVPTEADLPVGAADGDAYQTEDTDIMYVWDAGLGVWVGGSSLTGPPGPQGSQGLQGIKGDTGATGSQGAPGPGNVLTVSSTTTGAPGSNAIVSISGTSPTQSLDFTIPRGDVGTQGPPGGDPGEVKWFAMQTPPAGFLKANGALVSRTTYAVLFAAIGTIWGAGDGSSTFALPDMRGEFPRGWDDSRGIDAGRAFGSAQAFSTEPHSHSFTGDAMAAHNHTASSGGESVDHTHTFSDSSSATGTGSANHAHDGGGGGGVIATNTGTNWFGGMVAGSQLRYNAATNSTGAAHTHTVAVSGTTGGRSVGHTHVITNVAISAGTPAGTVGSFGSVETRPRNVALLACIKY